MTHFDDDTDAAGRRMSPEQRRQWVRHVLGCADLTAAQKVVLLGLETFADYRDGTNARPGEAILAQTCGLQARAVRSALERGRQLGLIERTRPANSRTGRASVYQLLPAPMTGTAVPVNDATTGTAVPVNNPTTGTAVPVNNPTTGMAMPVIIATTGTATHHDRHGHDTTTGMAMPPTLQAPSKHQSLVSESGTSPAPVDTHTDRPPSRFCDLHPHGYRGKCGDCGNARTAFNAWRAAAADRDVALAAADDLERQRHKRAIANCPDCRDTATPGWVQVPGRDDEAWVRCTHPRVIRAVGDG